MSGSRAKRKSNGRARNAAPSRQAVRPNEPDWSREEVRRRFMCNAFNFWRICGSQRCARQRACTGDAGACFERHWDFVTEADKIFFRTAVKARLAGMPNSEACRVAEEEVARCADYIAEVDAATKARLTGRKVEDYLK